MDNKRLEHLLDIVERNKRYKKEQELEREDSDIKDLDQNNLYNKRLKPEDVQVVLFAADSVFRESFIEMIQKKIVLTAFDKTEDTISFCLKYNKKLIIIDMDSPTDIDESIDIFSALKTAFSDARIFLATNKPNSWSVQNLQAKGGVLLMKPLLKNDIEKFVREHVYEGRR